jgi:NAD-dependent deacetylase
LHVLVCRSERSLRIVKEAAREASRAGTRKAFLRLPQTHVRLGGQAFGFAACTCARVDRRLRGGLCALAAVDGKAEGQAVIILCDGFLRTLERVDGRAELVGGELGGAGGARCVDRALCLVHLLVRRFSARGDQHTRDDEAGSTDDTPHRVEYMREWSSMMGRVAAWMRAADRVVVLTGAGISAESGVPVFRGDGGLWRQFRPEQLATPEAFEARPQLVWEWYLWRRARIAEAQPNPAHFTIARWQRERSHVTLLTQNVDGLHERAGSAAAIELHGNLWRVRCSRGCGYRVTDSETTAPRQELHCGCGAWLRPDVVWFGESLDPDALDGAMTAIEAADLVLVVGTSAVVYPVAALPQMARRRGARLVEINVEETPLTAHAHASLRGPAGELLPLLQEAL